MRTGPDSTPEVHNGGGKTVAPRNRYLLPALVTSVIVVVFVGGIFLMMAKLRERLRTKVMEHDSIVLQAAAVAQEEAPTTSREDLMAAALYASQANEESIFGVRLFDADGVLLDSFHKELLHTQLAPEAVESIRAGVPYSRFDPTLDLKTEYQPGR